MGIIWVCLPRVLPTWTKTLDDQCITRHCHWLRAGGFQLLEYVKNSVQSLPWRRFTQTAGVVSSPQGQQRASRLSHRRATIFMAMSILIHTKSNYIHNFIWKGRHNLRMLRLYEATFNSFLFVVFRHHSPLSPHSTNCFSKQVAYTRN